MHQYLHVFIEGLNLQKEIQDRQKKAGIVELYFSFEVQRLIVGLCFTLPSLTPPSRNISLYLIWGL